MTDFRDLIVWRKAIKFHKSLLPQLNLFPIEEVNCMAYSLRKSSLEISNNISNGCGRGSNQNLRYFLFISLGNAMEVESLLILSKELKYIDEGSFIELNKDIFEIKKMIEGLIKKIN